MSYQRCKYIENERYELEVNLPYAATILSKYLSKHDDRWKNNNGNDGNLSQSDGNLFFFDTIMADNTLHFPFFCSFHHETLSLPLSKQYLST